MRPFALRQHQVAQRLAPAGLRPGTDLDADGAAVGLGEVGNALVEVHVPALLPADPLLFLVDGVGRAVDHAAAAGRADVVHPDVPRGVQCEGHVGEHCGEPEVGAVLAADHRAVLAELAESRPDRQRDVQDVGGVRVPVGLGGEAPAANLPAEAHGDEADPAIGPHHLGRPPGTRRVGLNDTNRNNFGTLARYSREQGMCKNEADVDELFHESVRGEEWKLARSRG